MIASPLGTAVGGPIVAALGAAWTITASGTATIALPIIAGTLWTRRRRPSLVSCHELVPAAQVTPAETASAASPARQTGA